MRQLPTYSKKYFWLFLVKRYETQKYHSYSDSSIVLKTSFKYQLKPIFTRFLLFHN